MGPRQCVLRAVEQDTELDGLSPTPTEQDGEQHVFSAALEMIKNAAKSVIGPSALRSPRSGEHRG
jgi:hypothetical protein